MKNVLFCTVTFIACMLFASCGSNGGNGEKQQTVQTVTVMEQQKPTILVIPSDQLLNRFGKLQQKEILGKQLQIRDYNGYFLADPDSKFVISSIQDAFIQYGYPLNDFEQMLKSINDQEMIDAVTGIQKDAKTVLLTNARPDIILEVDYNYITDRSTRVYSKSLTFTLRAIDAFSNKVVATIQETACKEGKANTPAALAETILTQDSKAFTKQIDNYFKNIINTGREITLRVTIENGVNLSMSDECLDGDTYTDFIIDWIKVNAVLGAYNMSRNTDTEMYFVNVKIKTFNDNGTQYSAYDFARELTKALNKGCGIKSKNTTQGLGEANISIKGM